MDRVGRRSPAAGGDRPVLTEVYTCSSSRTTRVVDTRRHLAREVIPVPEIHQLTELQIGLLRVLWDRGEATVAEICDALRPSRALAPTTVATLLSRLERRGVVRHRTVSRQFIYAAA